MTSRRRGWCAGALAVATLLACTQPPDNQAGRASEVASDGCADPAPPAPVDVAEGVTMKGPAPEGALPLTLTGAAAAYELHLSVAGGRLPVDVSTEDSGSDNEPQPQFLTVRSSAEGSEAVCYRARSLSPITVFDPGTPVTVTVTSADGEPDAGTLALTLDDGTATETSVDGDLVLMDSRVGYDVVLGWEEASDAGYAVVVDLTMQQGFKTGVEVNEHRLVIPAGDKASVAVYPVEELTRAAVQGAPGIIPGAGVTTIVTPPG